jgi:hypothetical protein
MAAASCDRARPWHRVAYCCAQGGRLEFYGIYNIHKISNIGLLCLRMHRSMREEVFT